MEAFMLCILVDCCVQANYQFKKNEFVPDLILQKVSFIGWLIVWLKRSGWDKMQQEFNLQFARDNKSYSVKSFESAFSNMMMSMAMMMMMIIVMMMTMCMPVMMTKVESSCVEDPGSWILDLLLLGRQFVPPSSSSLA